MYIFWIIPVFLILYIIRIIIGPSVWDRLLGMNLVATKVVIIIIAFASLYELTYLLDFAIVYEIFGFISTIFISLFLMERKKGGKK
ncbi:MAG: monovalent cation/H+ antiporter complex subunit F [Oscillospiraceae bacterium]|nr:monovalent cation/H+ antiporter complex subunit F [Oscillospiraceae bacterium]